MKGNPAYSIVFARAERLSKIGARDDRILNGGIMESVAVEIFVGTDKRATVFERGNRCGMGGGEQRQGRDDHKSGENHVERFEVEKIRELRAVRGQWWGRRRIMAGLLKGFED